MKDEQYYKELRNRLNNIHTELSEKPEEYKMPYSLTIGGILNAYREGDVSFKNAVNDIKSAVESAIDYQTQDILSAIEALRIKIERFEEHK